MASVPITVLLYNGPLLCGFTVAIKGSADSFHKSFTALTDSFVALENIRYTS